MPFYTDLDNFALPLANRAGLLHLSRALWVRTDGLTREVGEGDEQQDEHRGCSREHGGECSGSSIPEKGACSAFSGACSLSLRPLPAGHCFPSVSLHFCLTATCIWGRKPLFPLCAKAVTAVPMGHTGRQLGVTAAWTEELFIPDRCESITPPSGVKRSAFVSSFFFFLNEKGAGSASPRLCYRRDENRTIFWHTLSEINFTFGATQIFQIWLGFSPKRFVIQIQQKGSNTGRGRIPLGEEEMQQGAVLFLWSLPASFIMLRAVVRGKCKLLNSRKAFFITTLSLFWNLVQGFSYLLIELYFQAKQNLSFYFGIICAFLKTIPSCTTKLVLC